MNLEHINNIINSNSRIIIIGTSGSGKTTLARNIAKLTGLKDVELDEIFWKKNWQESDEAEFRANIEKEIKAAKGFVIHGNYNKVRDLTWGNSNIVIWLNYSRFTVMWRIIKRTIIRSLTGKKLFSGNTETLTKSFLSRDSIILWAWNTYSLRKKQYEKLIRENPYNIEKFIILKSPGDANKFLSELQYHPGS